MSWRMSHFKFEVYGMSGRSSKTPVSSISRVGSLEGGWFLTHFLDVVGSLEDRWFLTHFLNVGYVLVMLI